VTRIPALRDELVEAAERHFEPVPQRRGSKRARKSLLLAAAFTIGTVGTAGAVLSVTGVVGQDPSRPVPAVRAEERSGMTRTRAPRLLAVGVLPNTGRVELVGYRMRGYAGRGELLCLDIAQPDGRRAGGCDNGLPGRAAGTLPSGSGPSEERRQLAVGATSEPASSVTVTYKTGERRASAKALLLPVSEGPASSVGISAFVYYVAELPSGATEAVARAHDERGNALWQAAFGD